MPPFSAFARAALCCVLLAAGCGAPAAPDRAADPPSLPALVAQLEGGPCVYSWPEACSLKPPGFFGFLSRALPQAKHSCVLAAARCLEKLGPAAAPAVPALIQVLREGPNDYDTGDGVIAARSGVALALAATRDFRAVGALAEALLRAEPMERPASAAPSGGRPAARHAILQGLASFGPAAAGHWESVAAVLRERNADRAYLERQRHAYEMSAAERIASGEIRAKNPGKSSYVIPLEAIEAARARLDPASPGYIRELESSALDHEAGAAARALGKTGVQAAGPLLVETLANFAAAEAAAAALADLGHAPPGAELALRRVLEPEHYGPRARAAAARALGAVGARGSTPALVRCLDDDDLMEAAAEALGRLGPGAKEALPRLRATLELPPLDAPSVEATRRQSTKTVAARAIAAIDAEYALSCLPAFAFERDAGWAVRETLLKLDPGGERVVNAIAAETRSPDAERRRRAVRYLGRFTSQAPVALLVDALDDADAQVRRAAAGSLRRIGRHAAPALPALDAALARATDPAERTELERAIGAVRAGAPR